MNGHPLTGGHRFVDIKSTLNVSALKFKLYSCKRYDFEVIIT